MVVSRRGMKCNASKACATSPPPSLMLTLHLRRFHVGSIGTNYGLKAYKGAVSATRIVFVNFDLSRAQGVLQDLGRDIETARD